MTTYTKTEPGDLDYENDYALWLAEEGPDTIESSAWVAETGIDINTTDKPASFTTTKATVWLDGGTYLATYLVSNTIVTVGGRTISRQFYVTIGYKFS